MGASSDYVLYFPSIEFNSDDWVKTALLFWDKIYRIVPSDYSPNDSKLILEAIDNDLIRNVSLEGRDLSRTADKFEKFCDNLYIIPAGLESHEYDRIHPDKIDSRLYPFLESIAYKFDDNKWLHLSKPLARGYMFYLSKVVAERRNLAKATDDPDSWAIAHYFMENNNFDEWISRNDADGYYSSLIIEDFMPSDIANIPIERVVDFTDENRELKARFRNKISEFTQNLSKCESQEFVLELVEDYKAELEESKNALKANMSFINRDNLNALFTMGIPVSMTVFGALGLINNPFSLENIFGSFILGAIAAYSNYSVASMIKRTNSYATYLINMENQLGTRGEIRRCAYAFNEFMND